MKKVSYSLFTLFLAFSLVACSDGDQKNQANSSDDITVSELDNHIKTLASDDYGGRAPGTSGGKKTVNYIKDQFKKAGLEPANNGKWVQKVPLVKIKADSNTSVEVEGLGQPVTLDNGGNAVVWTTHVKDKVNLKNSELVFVGYGIVAPQYGWNDYEDLDVEGKTVVMLVNDPGFATQDSSLFTGNAMTYYGRWTYKYEEAARQGAEAAIVIHETDPAGYPWEVVSSNTGAQYHLAADDKNMDDVKVEGWFTHEFANRLFKNIGTTYAEAKESALEEDFEPIPLEASMSTTLNNNIEEIRSENVAGILKGSKKPDETIIYTAHWDHLGTDPSLEGDQIYNGALDNGSGIAGLIEMGEKFSSLENKPERSILFLAVTAEESGLLGSQYYANNPIYPLGKTVANINMDMLMAYGKTKDIVLVGYGMNDLQNYLEEAVKEQDRVVTAAPSPEEGMYFRSDHFSFAKKGVPALYTESGINVLDGGKEQGRKLHEAFISNKYHKPADEYDPNWDLSGMKQDFQLLYQVGHTLADSDNWPEWGENVSFRETRRETADMRK